MEPAQPARCLLDFVFSASPLATSAITPKEIAKPHGGAKGEASASCSPSADGLSFTLGSLDADTIRRGAGLGKDRSTGGSGSGSRRYAPSHRRVSPASGLKPAAAAATDASATALGGIAVPSPLTTATPSHTWPQPATERGARAAIPFGPLSATSPPHARLVGVAASGGAEDDAPGESGERPTGQPEGSPAAAELEDSGVNALDQLIRLLLLPDDEAEAEEMGGPGMVAVPAAAAAANSETATGPAVASRRDNAFNDGVSAAEHGFQQAYIGSGDGGAGTVAWADAGGSGVAVAGGQPSGAAPLGLRGQPASAGGSLGLRGSGGPDRRAGPPPADGGHATAAANEGRIGDGEEMDDDNGLLGLRALAAALDEVDAALEWPAGSPQGLALPPDGPEYAWAGLQDEDGDDDGEREDREDGPNGWLPQGRGSSGAQPQQQQLRRPRRVARRAAAAAGRSGAADHQATAAAAGRQQHVTREGARGADGPCWKVLLVAPGPHNPEDLATLLLAGRLVNPRTAVPAPLLAAAAREHKQQQQQQQQQRMDGPAAAAGPGPAVAVVRCASEQDAAAALALNGRRLFAPPPTRSGADSWRPLTVVLQSWPGGGWSPGAALPSLAVPTASSSAAAAASPQAPHRTREAGPRVRRVVVSGLPGHLDGDDVIALFGNGLQLPGHCPTPQDRRFLLLCPDAASFSSLMEWSGARLPDKPLDALQQIVPRVADWCTVRVEEDDGIQLPALISQLMTSARISEAAAAGDSASTAAATAAAKRQQQYPRVAGRFHPAELDEMDELAASAAAAALGGNPEGSGSGDMTARRSALGVSAPPAGAAAAVGAAAPGAGGHSRGAADGGVTPAAAAAAWHAGSSRGGAAGGRAERPVVRDHSLEGRVDALSLYSSDDAAAAAERAESSRGASSSGLAARPAPRFRRTPAAGGNYAASVGAAGAFFGPAAGVGGGVAAAAACACCPLPSSGGRGGAGDLGATSWSGQAALELLNKLLALGIEPPQGPGQAGGGNGGAAEEERAPFFRRSRKRMPAHFGRRPEDEEGGDEEGGDGDGDGVTGPPGEPGPASASAAVALPSPASAPAAPADVAAARGGEAAVADGTNDVDAEDGGGLDDPS